MTIRLEATSIRAAKKEVQRKYPNGGKVTGMYEDLGVPDKPVYEATIFKRHKSMFRRKTTLNVKTTQPDYFIFEPMNSTNGEGE